MGFCFSCCRRRDKQTDSEREPLLRRASADQQTRNAPLEKAADVLAALHAGKLPTQEQIDNILKRLIRSNLLENDDALNEDGKKVIADARNLVETVLQAGLEKNHDNRLQDLVYNIHKLSSTVDVKEPAGLRLDNKRTKELKTAADAIPSQDELAADTTALLASLRTLASLFLTSSAFRLLLGDLLSTAREIVADIAEQVKTTAATVENVAEAIEIDVRPNNYQEVVEVKERPDSNVLVEELEERKSVKEVVLDRVEDIFRQAQTSPSHNAALRTLLYLLRKYAARVRLASVSISKAASESSGSSSIKLSAPVIVPDPRFSRVLEDLKVVLERFAGGSSLEPLLTALSKSVNDIAKTPEDSISKEVQILFNKIGSWLDKALNDPSFTTSRAGRETASKIYDDARELLSGNGELSKNLEDLLNEAKLFTDALKSDRSTTKLAHSIDMLHNDILLLLGRTARRGQRAATHWRTALARSALVWVLPRLMRAIRTLPMPRVEYVSTESSGVHMAAALDALLLSAEEALLPDVLSVQEWGEMRIELDENLGVAEVTSPNARLLSATEATSREDLESILPIPGTSKQPEAGPSKATKATKISSTSRVRIHVEGLRVAAHDVGYYGLYQLNDWLGYEDEGLLSLDVGRIHRRGEGLAVDIELEVDLKSDAQPSVDTHENEDRRLFRVVDVQTAMPGLALRISSSKHWILNSLLVPFVGPLGRAFGPRILDSQIRSALEKLEEVLRGVKDETEVKATEREGEGEDATVGIWDLWDVLLGKFGVGDGESEEGDENDDEDDHDVYTETHTEATTKAIVHTTITQPEPADIDAEVPPPSESAYAVGLGAQLLPGKGEPVGFERETLAEGAQDLADAGQGAVSDIQEALGNASETIHGAARQGVAKTIQTRQELDRAGIRMKRQERSERKNSGWKSSAFTL